jgi:taurine dioxygenase
VNVETSDLAWTPVMDNFGAEVDVDLAGKLSPEVASELQRLFDQRHLLIFREQDIDYDRQRAIASLFGNVLSETKYISNEVDLLGAPRKERDHNPTKTTMFHNDYAFTDRVLEAICLWGESVSDACAGTLYASLRTGYLLLTDDERTRLRGLSAVQAVELFQDTNHLRFKKLPQSKSVLAAAHPLIFTHPRTGEEVLLYIPHFTHSIVDMPDEEAAVWFERFESLLYDESRVYRHRWRPKDLLIWDNIYLQHAREHVGELPDPPPSRTLRRVAIGRAEPNVYA